MKPRIRLANASDAAAVAGLLRELGYGTSERQARDRLAATGRTATRVIVAEGASQVIGFLAAQRVSYFPDGSDLLRITGLVVAPASRRAGVGKALIDAAVQHAKEHGCAGVEVTTATRRANAHRFYERLGFSRTSYRFFRGL